MHIKPTTVIIFGLGIIGGSLLKALSLRNYQVIGYDINSDTVNLARNSGFNVSDNLIDILTKITQSPTILVIATPYAAVVDLLPKLPQKQNFILIDVCSVKQPVLELVEAQNLTAKYIGTHPMTGKATKGFAAATTDLFENAVWAISICETTDKNNLIQVTDLIFSLNSKILTLTAADHDKFISRLSHLPHLAAAGLCLTQTNFPAPALAAGSFKDLTRIMDTPAPNIINFFGPDINNSESFLAQALKQYIENLQYIQKQLRNPKKLTQILTEANSVRQLFKDFKTNHIPIKLTDVLKKSNWRSELLTLGKNQQLLTN